MVDVKIKLSALWVAHMLSTTYADVLRLYDPGEVAASFSMTHELMLVSAITMVIPIVMVVLSLTLKDKANRWANIIVGIFKIVIVLASLFIGESWAYYIFGSIVEVVLLSLIVWYAWKWPKQEGQP
jgi:ABC-type uncharacterized transport system permease subunit